MIYRQTNLYKRINAKGVCAAVLCVVVVCSCAHGFTFLDFPSDSAVQAGGYKVWQLDQFAPPKVTQSYAIESSLDADLVSGASAAALNAITSWDNASAVVDFSPAGYEPAESGNGMGGARQWEGPAGIGVGANIDILARPRDFTLTDFRGKVYGFGGASMAFTVISAISGNIQSVDIYLNSQINLINPSYQWATGGGDMDVETVILHELGHSIGWDHPDQVSGSAANYDPYTFQPGYQSIGEEVMYSTYYPNGANRTLTDDEIGGLYFLYPGVQGDANGDSNFTFLDVQLVIDAFFGFVDPLGVESLHNIDFNADGQLNFSDVDAIITKYFYPGSQEYQTGSSLSYLQDEGYDVSNIPEPHTIALLVGGLCSGFCLRNRQKRV